MKKKKAEVIQNGHKPEISPEISANLNGDKSVKNHKLTTDQNSSSLETNIDQSDQEIGQNDQKTDQNDHKIDPNDQIDQAASQIKDLCLKNDVEYKVYENELQMPDIMRLIQKDLSEPYSIYTYRYFIHNWPHLCFMVSNCYGTTLV